MKVQDKDLDRLFSQKLANVEMEPPAMVWDKIANELDGKKEEKKGLPFMRIAAGIVVIMGIGLFFIRPVHQKIALHASVNQTTTDVNQSSSPAIAPVQPQPLETLTADVAQPANRVKHRASKTNVGPVTQNTQLPVTKTDEPEQVIAYNPVQPVNASNALTKTDVPVKQNNNLVPEIKSMTRAAAAVEQPQVIANVPAANDAKAAVKKRKIRSLGDLLNVVIAKVDKRDDKLIEFTNTSDDDSFNLTGVNLGLLKAKKDK